MPISPQERIARLQLYRTTNIGAVTFTKLLNRFGSAIESINAIGDITARHGKAIVPAPTSQIESELEAGQQASANLLVLGDDDFPAPLAHTDGMPPILWVKGHQHLLNKNSIAIVGARTSTDLSNRYAYRIAQELGKNDFCITSGMARGIDSYAHQGALQTGTIAVMAGGVDICYPKAAGG